jgi:hypothetical protein
MRYDILPDIHGQSEKLKHRLSELGYCHADGTWGHPHADRHCVFLGDFIDSGPDNAGVIGIVRRMIDDGRASAIMGNHELNAIHFHTADPETGDPIRPHTKENGSQHESFLNEFPLGAQRTAEVIDWMKTLPLFLEYSGFRVVHACWNEATINALKAVAPTGRFSDEQLVMAGRRGDPLSGRKSDPQKAREYCTRTRQCICGPRQGAMNTRSLHWL